MSDQIWIAVLTAFVSITLAWVTASRTSKSASKRLQREFAFEYASEAAVRSLLNNEGWELREFEQVKRRLGGFDDDQLRQLLVRAGAVRAYRKSDGAELWGLTSRNPQLINKAEHLTEGPVQ